MSARKPPVRRLATSARPPPAAPPDAPAETQDIASPPAVPRYRVLSGGISTPSGAYYHGTVLTAEQIGDTERVAHLLAKGAIEEVG